MKKRKYQVSNGNYKKELGRNSRVESKIEVLKIHYGEWNYLNGIFVT